MNEGRARLAYPIWWTTEKSVSNARAVECDYSNSAGQQVSKTELRSLQARLHIPNSILEPIPQASKEAQLEHDCYQSCNALTKDTCKPSPLGQQIRHQWTVFARLKISGHSWLFLSEGSAEKRCNVDSHLPLQGNAKQNYIAHYTSLDCCPHCQDQMPGQDQYERSSMIIYGI